MPRINASNADPIDICRFCWPTEDEAFDDFGDWGDGPDGRGNCFSYDDAHPPYDDDDNLCYYCGRILQDVLDD